MQNSTDAASQIPLWITVVASLIGGGAMGAIITAFVTNYRNRMQPIGYKSEKIEVFKKEAGLSSLHARIMLTDERTTYNFDNLVIVRLTLTNKGNQDIAEFSFGMTLLKNDEAIRVQVETPDRHHIAEPIKAATFDSPTSEIDYKLKPFNRNDTYIFNLFITVESNEDANREVKLSSVHSVKFTPMPIGTRYIPSPFGGVAAPIIEKLIKY
jgi:hypothetical protein